MQRLYTPMSAVCHGYVLSAMGVEYEPVRQLLSKLHTNCDLHSCPPPLPLLRLSLGDVAHQYLVPHAASLLMPPCLSGDEITSQKDYV